MVSIPIFVDRVNACMYNRIAIACIAWKCRKVRRKLLTMVFHSGEASLQEESNDSENGGDGSSSDLNIGGSTGEGERSVGSRWGGDVSWVWDGSSSRWLSWGIWDAGITAWRTWGGQTWAWACGWLWSTWNTSFGSSVGDGRVDDSWHAGGDGNNGDRAANWGENNTKSRGGGSGIDRCQSAGCWLARTCSWWWSSRVSWGGSNWDQSTGSWVLACSGWCWSRWCWSAFGWSGILWNAAGWAASWCNRWIWGGIGGSLWVDSGRDLGAASWAVGDSCGARSDGDFLRDLVFISQMNHSLHESFQSILCNVRSQWTWQP